MRALYRRSGYKAARRNLSRDYQQAKLERDGPRGHKIFNRGGAKNREGNTLAGLLGETV